MQSEEKVLKPPKIIREAFFQASSFLRQAGIDSPEFEAEYLLKRLLRLSRTQLFVRMLEAFPAELIGRWRDWLQRRARQEPLQYIVGEEEFYGRLFRVTPDVLIPRPETELLVQAVLEEAEKWCRKKEIELVDIGAGSGCISITLAKERPRWKVKAVDLSTAALQVAKENAERLKCSEQCQWIEGNLLEPITSSFDVLVSNPPYISEREWEGLEQQVKEYEPELALIGGEDGLEPYRKIVAQLCRKKNLPSRLFLAFEIGAYQGPDVLREIQKIPGLVKGEIRKDFAERDRIVLGWIENW